MDIRPASTLVLARDSANGLQVLMLQRTWDAVFLPGFFVFPGGAVDDDEHLARAHGTGSADADISQTMSLDEGGADYMLAALRESFEEAGVLIAANASGELIDHHHPAFADRQSMIDGELSFSELCHRHNITLPLDHLAYLAHWITPPGPPRRFDTRFFVAAMPEGQAPHHDGIETIDHVWISPQQALDDHREGQRLIGLPTLQTLRLLSSFADVTSLMRYAHANPPDAFPEKPWPALKKGKAVILEPGAPAYDEASKLDPEGEGSVAAEIIPGQPVEIGAGVIRLTAPNPGMMTGPGTNTYLLGFERFTVIDPGPNDAKHIDRILEMTGGNVDQVLVTHTHMDHSPGAATLKERTQCRVYGLPAPDSPGQDGSFWPDDRPEHGDLIATEAGVLKAIHTPGHASNHVCYLLVDQHMLFSGDHIMQGSTVVINPPDGDMKAYVESLYELLAESMNHIAPAHGFLMAHPDVVIDYLITHRLAREHKIERALKKAGRADLKSLTALAYDDVPAGLHGLASRSALAHLLKLEAEGHAVCRDDYWQLSSLQSSDHPMQSRETS